MTYSYDAPSGITVVSTCPEYREPARILFLVWSYGWTLSKIIRCQIDRIRARF